MPTRHHIMTAHPRRVAVLHHIHPLAVFLILSALLLGVALAIASRAIGEPTIEPRVTAYAATYAQPICAALDNHPSIAGLQGVALGVMQDGGFTGYQSGQIVALAVHTQCPQHIPLLTQFAYTYTPEKATT
jgi:uncharacterized protein DUF732